MIRIKCACSETEQYLSPVLWREHYDKARPRSASGRKEYALIHRAIIVYDNTGKPEAPAPAAIDPRETRLFNIQREIDQAFDYIRLLEMEQLSILKEMTEPEAPQNYHPSTWFRRSIELGCVECGRKTKWRYSSVPGGEPRCKDNIHREKIETTKTTRGVSDKVWAILLDEEVE